MSDARLAVAESMLKEHERRIGESEAKLEEVSSTVSRIDTNVAVLVAQFQVYRKDQERSARKDRWVIGAVVAVANVIVDILLLTTGMVH